MLSRAFLPASAILCLAAVTVPAAAQFDAFSQKFGEVRNAVGLNTDHAPIDFTERPPLVVPPTNTLPPPGSGVATLGVQDPDVIARRNALTDSRRPVPPSDPGAGAKGREARTYLIDPPSGLRDPDTVAAASITDGPAVDTTKTGARHHHAHKKSAATEASQ